MEEKKKEVSEQDIKKRVKEWVLAIVHFIVGDTGYCPVPVLKCPVPGCCGEVRYTKHNHEWRCIWEDCGFVIPEHLAPPAFSAIKEACDEREKIEFLLKTDKRVLEILTKY
ncbi:MAG: hypothetical protein Q8N69_01060 [bacterium]|nr:hypothetical protein [bacterium]